MQEIKESNPKIQNNLKYDLPAGLVVFLVALPLCLGISLASGADPITGVLAGVVGGIVVGLISKSSLGVSGPAAGLAAIIADYLSREQIDYKTFLLIVFTAGILQVIFGIVRGGVIADYFPSTIIKGMLAAIGLLLILKQIPSALGNDKNEIINAFVNPHLGAVLISIFSLAILIIWQTNFLKKQKALALIPSPLLVVILGVGLNYIFGGWFPQLQLKQSHLVNIPIYENMGDFFKGLQTPNFSKIFTLDTAHYTSLWDQYIELFTMAFTIALVASLESLLSVEATDKLDPFKRITPTNRELIAQGAGNIASSLIGGLPVTQVIVRSSANINTGGRTQVSTVFHGILLFGTVLIIPFVLNLIPLSALAAILLMIGYKLANINLFKSMYRLGFRQFIPFVVTIIAILSTDLLIGIVIGLILSVFFILQTNRKKEPWEVTVERDVTGKYKYIVNMIFQQEVNYLSKNILLLSLHDIPKESKVLIDASESMYVSNDIYEAIQEFRDFTAKKKQIDLTFKTDRKIYDVDEKVVNNVTMPLKTGF